MTPTALLASSADLRAILSYHVTSQLFATPEALVGAGVVRSLLPGAELSAQVEYVAGRTGMPHVRHALLQHAVLGFVLGTARAGRSWCTHTFPRASSLPCRILPVTRQEGHSWPERLPGSHRNSASHAENSQQEAP
jgi:hypothetical protein